MFEINHQTVLVTGATSGIGQQVAQDYAEKGWNVVACGRNQAKLAELALKFPNIATLAFDITDADACREALSGLEPCPTLWVLNAGDCEYIDDGVMDAALFRRVITVNVIGLSNCIEAIQDQFTAGHRLAIVGSISSELALPRAEAYGASKAAVKYLAHTLRMDLAAKQVHVSTIFPGFVETPLTDKNNFAMPMIISVEQASKSLIDGLSKGKSNLYFPRRFTSIIRLLGTLPYSWQHALIGRLLKQP
jgi:NADP-dependent 3-hydroxy acid dehydrogenase YdfG